jgi:hypothetical protein
MVLIGATRNRESNYNVSTIAFNSKRIPHIHTFRGPREGGRVFLSLFEDTREKVVPPAAGREFVAPRECRRSRVASPCPDCWKATARCARPAVSMLPLKNCSRASHRQNRVCDLLPPYPSRRLAIRRRAACSSIRFRGLPAADRAIVPPETWQFSSMPVRVARGNRSVRKKACLRSGIANGCAPAALLRRARARARGPPRFLLFLALRRLGS